MWQKNKALFGSSAVQVTKHFSTAEAIDIFQQPVLTRLYYIPEKVKSVHDFPSQSVICDIFSHENGKTQQD